MNCVECDHKCYEYLYCGYSDKSYYEWTLKQDKCEQEENGAGVSHRGVNNEGI